MKKVIITIVLTIFVVVIAFAQPTQPTQFGYVKTKGRMDSEGQIISGMRIGGAAITLAGGHSTVADSNGNFKITVPDNKFYLKNVQKQGYVLVDPDVLLKQYEYSNNPLVISMETPEKKQADQLANERRIRRELQKQLQLREQRIDSLLEQNKITEEEHREALQKLYNEQATNERLISEMAKRYAEVDYDLLDEFYQQVTFCIGNGNLVKADSLLRSRGNVEQKVEVQMRKGQAIQEQREQLREQLQQLQQADTVYAAENEELARLLYSYYERFLAQFQHDSAAYYLELRARLDTTNVNWQLDVVRFINNYLADHNKALAYAQRTLRQALSLYGENHPDMEVIYNNIGAVYEKRGDYTLAFEYHQKALTILISIYGENNPYVATCYNNIGGLYDKRGDHTLAFEYLQKALTILISIYGENNPYVATSYNNIGVAYYAQRDYPQALEYNRKALSIRKSIFGENHTDVATSYNNIGVVYDAQGDYSQALEYHQKSLDIYKFVYGKSHPEVARCYNNIGSASYNQGNDTYALEYFQKAMDTWKSFYGENHPDVALCYHNIGMVYEDQGDYANAMVYCQKAMDIWKSFYGENHPDVARCYNNIGMVYEDQGDYANAMVYFQKALDICKSFYKVNHPDVARYYGQIGHLYYDQDDYAKALEYYQKDLSILKSIYGDNHLYVATIYNNIGAAYHECSNYVKALDYYQKALIIRKSLLGEDHQKTKLVYSNIMETRYTMTVADPETMKLYVFIVTIVDGETPAKAQGLSGEYVVLEFGDWSIDSTFSLFDVNAALKGKPKTILIMKDDVISQHSFENTLGAQLDLRQVGEAEKNRIKNLYHKWKKYNN